MEVSMPITLSGDNLGLRHRYLNALVTEAYTKGVPFQEIQELPDATPVDRLFKIDLASKLRNVDYILQNIKDEDMLYVSRALKAKWLLEEQYQDIVNPKYLENNLYAFMITTAVSKFKNWLYLYLKDEQRCADFYQFYTATNFDYAVKFLGHCSVDFILSEVPAILDKLSPHDFKILCEKCPQVAKVYFDNIQNNDKLKMIFLDSHLKFYNSLKVVLKLASDIFFEITERYFDHKYNRSLTKHIMTKHKDRFEKKPELYAGMLLDMATLAECLSSEECQELVLKLARASYLEVRVDYKFVEPLVRRLPRQERAALKKLVFVQKSIGQQIKTWPYAKPSLPEKIFIGNHVFTGRDKSEFCLSDLSDRALKLCLRCDAYSYPNSYRPMRTYLDKLFDEYRFMSFERTLYMLRNKIRETSSSQNREYMLLVLVSKSGGEPGLVASLLQLLKQHSNEPANVRAAVVRSLVKRAAVWRLPQHSWQEMLEFARGLGLDGSTPEADCREGLHAVVIRSLLEKGTCEPTIRDAFLKEISYLDEYSINTHERKVIRDTFPQLILTSAEAETSPARQAQLLDSLFDMLRKYKVDITNSLLIPAVAALQKRDSSAAEGLLRRLFRAKIARRTLFQENFSLIQTDASYLNALRHDTSILDVSMFVELIERNEIRPEQFLRKLATYFAESSGMMEHYLTKMRERILTNESIGKSIARPLCLLQGANLGYLDSLDVANKAVVRLAAAIRANMHVGRPKLDLNGKASSTIGVKAVANKVLACPAGEAKKYVNELLTCKRTVRVALILAERIGQVADAYVAAAALRPTATLKTALKYFRRRGTNFDPHVWEVCKKLMNNSDLCTEKSVHLCNYMKRIENIPSTIKPEYCTILFNVLKKHQKKSAMRILHEIENLVHDVNDEFIKSLLLDFMNGYDINKCKENQDPDTDTFLRIYVKFLLLCTSEDTQKKRFGTVGEPFLNFLSLCLNMSDKYFMNVFRNILYALQYNKVFFDDTYVSPLPVLDNIVKWMQKNLPIELHFNMHVHINLTTLYMKSIRLSIQSNPDIFNNEKRRLNEGITIVGHIFGSKIAQEVNRLKGVYFTSAVELYRTGMEGYFRDYFQYDVTKFKFMKAVIEGILKGSTGDAIRTALYLLKSEHYNFDRTDSKELLEDMHKIVDDKFKYFFCFELTELRT